MNFNYCLTIKLSDQPSVKDLAFEAISKFLDATIGMEFKPQVEESSDEIGYVDCPAIGTIAYSIVEPEATEFYVPKGSRDKVVAYVAIRFKEDDTKAQFLGYLLPMDIPEENNYIALSALQEIEDLSSFLYKIELGKSEIEQTSLELHNLLRGFPSIIATLEWIHRKYEDYERPAVTTSFFLTGLLPDYSERVEEDANVLQRKACFKNILLSTNRLPSDQSPKSDFEEQTALSIAFDLWEKLEEVWE